MTSRQLPALPPAPAGRLEAARPPAELGARTGGSPGTANPARLQAVGEAGGRAPRGRERANPRPGLVAAAVGASCGGAKPAGRSFSFGERGGWHKSGDPFRPAPSLGLVSALGTSGDPHPSPLSPHLCFSGPAPTSPEEPHLPRSTQGPNLGQRDSPPGPVRGREALGAGSTGPAWRQNVCVLLPAPRFKCPRSGRTCIGQHRDHFWPAGF